MKLSIITVCYNSASTIADTVRSVLSQTYRDVEYIIVDGGSRDDTLAIIKDNQKNHSSDIVFKIISEPDNGLYDAMNKGIAMATGEIVGILNSDDIYQDEKVLEDVAARFATQNCDAVYSDLVYVDSADTTSVRRFWKAGNYHRSSFLWGWMLPHPTFFVRRNLYEKFGVFRTDFRQSADYELILRFLYKNKIVASYIPRVLIRMRTGGASNATLKNRLTANREDRKAWKVNRLRILPFTHILKPLRKISQYRVN